MMTTMMMVINWQQAGWREIIPCCIVMVLGTMKALGVVERAIRCTIRIDGGINGHVDTMTPRISGEAKRVGCGIDTR
jgi:hypothetical protein